MAIIASKGNGTWGIMADMPLDPAPTLAVCCRWYHRKLDCLFEPAKFPETDAGFTLTVAEEEFAGVAGENSAAATAVFVMAPATSGVTTISTSAMAPL